MAADFRRIRPAGNVPSRLVGAKVAAELLRPRGRQPKDHPKEQPTLRLDADILEHFKLGGLGWQTRVNAMLRRAAAKYR